MKVAVIGSGICGLSAARALCARGHAVTLFEQFELFHERGSSHGASRIVRRAYTDPFYTECMEHAYPMWSDLEAESGEKILHECGLLYYGRAQSSSMKSMIAGLEALNVFHETLDSSAASNRLPRLCLSSGEIAVWTPEAGWVNAAKTLEVLYGLACNKGLEVRCGTAVDPIQLSKEYDAVVLAAGSWTMKHASVPVTVTLQTFAYVDAMVGGPVWIEDGAMQTYGFPSESIGQKIGVHHPGPSIDPDSLDRNPSVEMLEIIRETARRRFRNPAPRLLTMKTCLYTSTSTEDFLVGNLAPNVFFASACSGHGFKLGLWIGSLLADFVEGKDRPENHPRWVFSPL